MLPALSTMMLVLLQIPWLNTDELPFRASETAATVTFITVPLGVLLLLLARVFWQGKYLGFVAGYKSYGVEQPARMGRLVGTLVGVLGFYQLIFPVTVHLWGEGAFVAYIFVIVGLGVALLVGGSYFERG